MENKTVIFLGAGASQPYRFPLGSELKEHLKNTLANGQSANRVKALGHTNELINDFEKVLKYSNTYQTIDHLLSAKKRFRDLGSYLIAEALLPSEQHGNIFPVKDWYWSLFSKLDITNNLDACDHVQFITLNYDRSLEHFLYHVAALNIDEDYEKEAETALGKIKIIHPHGSLGRYPEVPYGAGGNINSNIIQQAAKQIRIISDHLEDEPAFKEAKDALNEADQIAFIGFGYHPITLELMFDDLDFSTKSLIGTSVGLDSKRKDYVEVFFGRRIKLHAVKAVDFVKNIVF